MFTPLFCPVPFAGFSVCLPLLFPFQAIVHSAHPQHQGPEEGECSVTGSLTRLSVGLCLLLLVLYYLHILVCFTCILLSISFSFVFCFFGGFYILLYESEYMNNV